MTKPIELTILLRNNRMKKARKERGISQMKLAEFVGVSWAVIQRLERLQYKFRSRHAWRLRRSYQRYLNLKEKVADFLGSTMEEMFPPELETVRSSRVTRELDVPSLMGLYQTTQKQVLRIEEAKAFENLEVKERSVAVGEIVSTLNPRLAKMIRLRFGMECGAEMTLDDCAEQMGVSRERCRQLEAKAIRQLRHPSRSKILRKWLS